MASRRLPTQAYYDALDAKMKRQHAAKVAKVAAANAATTAGQVVSAADVVAHYTDRLATANDAMSAANATIATLLRRIADATDALAVARADWHDAYTLADHYAAALTALEADAAANICHPAPALPADPFAR